MLIKEPMPKILVLILAFLLVPSLAVFIGVSLLFFFNQPLTSVSSCGGPTHLTAPEPVNSKPAVSEKVSDCRIVEGGGFEITFPFHQPRMGSTWMRQGRVRMYEVSRFANAAISFLERDTDGATNPLDHERLIPAVPASVLSDNDLTATALREPLEGIQPERARNHVSSMRRAWDSALVCASRPEPALRMASETIAGSRHDLNVTANAVTLGNLDVLPLPTGVPGGRVVGNGKDIRGVLRFSRLKHPLSDWWADASSLNNLVRWINARTHIRTDMNVTGGSVKLADANLMKCPILFMTGHDPSLVRSRNLVINGDRLDAHLSNGELARLRRYLLEKGGFLVFDDCGVNAPAQAMVRIIQTQLRRALPEYAMERIQNAHEIYHNYYPFAGPPIGYDIFWWGTQPPKRNYLEGVSIDGRLTALIVRRDYLCALRTVSGTEPPVHYIPEAFRFLTNVVIYSLTHGSISDYSGYIPELPHEDGGTHLQLPQRARMAATPIGR